VWGSAVSFPAGRQTVFATLWPQKNVLQKFIPLLPVAQAKL